MREVRRDDTETLQKQLQIKTKEVEMYQKEAANQKMQNQKLRDKMKELVARKNAAGGAIDQDVHNKNQANMPEIAHNEH